MALTFEVSNRVENQDFRRVLFNKQLEILNIVDEIYKERAAQEIKDILKVCHLTITKWRKVENFKIYGKHEVNIVFFML